MYFWNMAGSMINALSSILLTMAVTRLFGDGNESDIFSIAYSTALMLSTLGLFEARQFQTSDIKKEYKFSEYLFMRCLTCILMMISAFIFVLIKNYDFEKSLIIILVCFYMMIGALEDVYQGLFQLNNRLDLSGKSLFIRIIISMLFFFATIILKRNLTLSCIMLCVGSLFVFFAYDLVMEYKITKKNQKPSFSTDKQKHLFKECFPLCACSFMAIYVLNAPKYTIDTLFSYQQGMQTVFSVIIMPAAVINLFSIFAFRPIMIPMATKFQNKDIKGFLGLFKRISGWIVVVTAACIAGGYFWGIPFLELIYKIDLSEYHISLIVILLGGGFSALLSVLQYMITILRKQYRLLIGYAAGGIFAYFASNYFVQNYGIFGGAISYLLTYVFIAIFFAFLIFCLIKKLKFNDKENKSEI